MIILDTNVLSELMRPEPAASVVNWIAAQSTTSLYTTSITQAEILHGIKLLPTGRKRTRFEDSATAMFEEDFADRILPFDVHAAQQYAGIADSRRRAGMPVSAFDAQIAAIARASGAALATRNTADFQRCGIKLIDPWKR